VPHSAFLLSDTYDTLLYSKVYVRPVIDTEVVVSLKAELTFWLSSQFHTLGGDEVFY
jgi:hypothetical protein